MGQFHSSTQDDEHVEAHTIDSTSIISSLLLDICLLCITDKT